MTKLFYLYPVIGSTDDGTNRYGYNVYQQMIYLMLTGILNFGKMLDYT